MCKELGCTVYLLTVEKLRNANWPREAIDEMFFMPEELSLKELLHAVSYAARTRHFDRVVALDEFDMENVAAIREHLRLPGIGLTTVRYFRDKLAMRARAQECGIVVPEFIHILNYDDLREFMARVPGPWLLKPRAQASGIGMKKIQMPEDLWPWLDQLGDRQSEYLLEQFIPGSVFHVDGVVSERAVLFAEVHGYGAPPLDVSHHGGVFTTRTLPRDTPDAMALKELHKKLVECLGLVGGVTHGEFLIRDEVSPMNIRIRAETPADAQTIEAVTASAFRNAPHSSHSEQHIVNALRTAGKLAVSLVAEADSSIIGHVAISPVSISDGASGWFGLGPISVLPQYQRRGVGSQLMREALRLLRSAGGSGCGAY